MTRGIYPAGKNRQEQGRVIYKVDGFNGNERPFGVWRASRNPACKDFSKLHIF